MRRLFVPLTRPEFDHLLAIARTERRRVQDQAAIILTRSLRNDQVTEPSQDTAAPERREMAGSPTHEVDHAQSV